ncbi:hypothetical protein B0H13DRAFT_1850667 [Mycena leptocephala]|nr:hypothetical protein B0H13DRAFT_1850667 [Mycena leptocephala]
MDTICNQMSNPSPAQQWESLSVLGTLATDGGEGMCNRELQRKDRAISGGRMVLHRVVVREGAGMRMRFRDRQMHEQLLTLAKSLPHQTDEREAVVAAATEASRRAADPLTSCEAACSSLPHIYPAQAWNCCGNFEAPFALPLDPKQAKLKGVPMSWATQAGSRNAGVLPALASYVATTATKPSIRIRCLAVALGNISVAPTQQNAIGSSLAVDDKYRVYD